MITVGLIAVPPMQLMSLSAMTVLQTANSLADDPAYGIELVSEVGGLVETSSGFCVDRRPNGDARFHTLLVSAFACTQAPSQSLAASVRQLAADARRVGSYCTGAFVFAEAGLLEGCRASTLWRHLPRLEQAFPNVYLLPDRPYVNDCKVWTAAGMTAGIDMVLAFVEASLGEEAARAVDERMIMKRLQVAPAYAIIIALRHRIDTIAAETGIADREHMRRAFLQVHGPPPQDLRYAARELAAA